MSAEASASISPQEPAETPWPKSSWLQRRFRRLAIGVVVGGVVLSGVAGLMLRSRRKP